MADEQLQLAAVVLDRFSAPIVDMARKLRQLTEQNAKSHVQGAGLAKLHGESFNKLRESVGKSAESLRREFLPTIEKITEQALGLRLALGGVAGAGRRLSLQEVHVQAT